MSNQIVQKLFRKRSPIPEFPGVSGLDPVPVPARRNRGNGAVSALILKAVVLALEGVVLAARIEHYADGTYAVVTEHRGSKGKRMSGICLNAEGQVATVYAPKGLSYGVTYHLPLTALVEALTRPAEATDLVAAYRNLLQVWADHGRRPPVDLARVDVFRDAILRVCDEAYFWMRYGPDDPEPENDRTAGAEISFSDKRPARPVRVGTINEVVQALTDLAAFDAVVHGARPASSAVRTLQIAGGGETGFVGWQYGELKAAVQAGENVLLAGPTGSGKTFCTVAVMQVLARAFVTARGMEGLTDLDVIGAIVPRPGGAREWVDGPLTRALRLAQKGPVTFFLDEVTRLPRVHLNLLPGLLNPQSAGDLRRQGVEPEGTGPFYALELPMVGEVVWAPCARFQVVAAGNFGRQYAVYDLDPAVRRRFETVLEFDYLPFDEEVELVVTQAGLDQRLAGTLVKVAAETRRLHANGELPGALDTGSLLVWARKVTQRGVSDANGLLHLAGITWLDQVAGRDHAGAVVEANALAIGDFIRDLAA